MTDTQYHVIYACHPDDAMHYDTDALRRHFVMEQVMVADKVTITCAMTDRLIYGGAMPVSRPLRLENIEPLKADYFIERREMGIINIGGEGVVTVDGVSHRLLQREALYVGMGSREVTMESLSAAEPARFWICSAPAHLAYPVQHVTTTGRDGTLRANSFTAGSSDDCNARTINQLIVKGVLAAGPCRLQMGLTELHPGSVWNTMPAHTHLRRSEVYFYHRVPQGHAVAHIMGEPQQTRLVWLHDCQAILSPEWSIHSGAGTASYSFIWSMSGENLDYTDMDHVAPDEMK